mgnify:FL=1|jgi:uncharacterized protein (DUF3820 family)
MIADDSLMPWGIHKGRRMEQVPAKYLMWLLDNNKVTGEVRVYILDRLDVLEKQVEEENNFNN